MHRTYENEDLVVFWDSDKCFHARKCILGSPKTFDPRRRPWIELGHDDNKNIWQTISECPSGALKCIYGHGVEVVMDEGGSRSVALLGDEEIGECDFSKTDEGWNIYHTGVSPEHERKGIAKRLVYKVIETAERNNEPVLATCSYAKRVISS